MEKNLFQLDGALAWNGILFEYYVELVNLNPLKLYEFSCLTKKLPIENRSKLFVTNIKASYFCSNLNLFFKCNLIKLYCKR